MVQVLAIVVAAFALTLLLGFASRDILRECRDISQNVVAPVRERIQESAHSMARSQFTVRALFGLTLFACVISCVVRLLGPYGILILIGVSPVLLNLALRFVGLPQITFGLAELLVFIVLTAFLCSFFMASLTYTAATVALALSLSLTLIVQHMVPSNSSPTAN